MSVIGALLLGWMATAPLAKPVTFAWPTPDILEETEVPNVVRARGIPMKLRAVRVKHPIDEMIRVYVQAFQRAHFYIPPPKSQVEWYREPTLTALDPDRQISYTVVFQGLRDGTTTLILGEANLGLREAAPSNGAPVFPGAAHVLRSEMEGAESVTYEATGTVSELLAFYRDLLKPEGYQQSEETEHSAVFHREGSEIRISAEPRKGAPLRVSLIRRASAQETLAPSP